MAGYALLDDHLSVPIRPTSRLYRQWQDSLECLRAADLADWERQLRHKLNCGLHAVIVADYEWGLQLHGLEASVAGPPPTLRAELFSELDLLDKTQVEAWLTEQTPTDEAGLLGWRTGLEEERFAERIADIQAAIAAGETYQVNFTFRLEGRSWGHPAALYRLLRQRQPTRYGALIWTPAEGGLDEWTLSFSPELFLRRENDQILAQPMKGTIAVPEGADEPALDKAAQCLRQDPKNRAENIMIVDLLRNDLGRIAEPGTVAVSGIFDVHRVGRVLGMTSTVAAQLRPGVGLADVLRATYPCGSITGAPKRAALRCIDGLEENRRGRYTGAIGWVAPGEKELDFCLSIPIRTLLLSGTDPAAGSVATHRVRLGVGAGIVWDSVASAEWSECLAKGRFATEAMAGLALFETMKLAPGQYLPDLWSWHQRRLAASAAELGFVAGPEHWEQLVYDYVKSHRGRGDEQVWRLRLMLHQNGQVDFAHHVLSQEETSAEPVVVLLSPNPSSVPAWLRRHKTTLRPGYAEALQEAAARGAFDCLYVNESGHLTEGTRCNIFIRLEEDPHWLTPPVQDGLLPGVARQALLEDPSVPTQEQSLTKADLLAAREIFVCNALRGVLRARVEV